jgi:hypothetical protein
MVERPSTAVVAQNPHGTGAMAKPLPPATTQHINALTLSVSPQPHTFIVAAVWGEVRQAL